MFSFLWFAYSVKVVELLRAADATVTWMAMKLILTLNTVDPLFQQIHGLWAAFHSHWTSLTLEALVNVLSFEHA